MECREHSHERAFHHWFGGHGQRHQPGRKKKKLDDKLAIDTSWVLGNYKLETDAMVQSTLQGTLQGTSQVYGKNLMAVLQDVATAVDAGQTASRDLAPGTKK